MSRDVAVIVSTILVAVSTGIGLYILKKHKRKYKIPTEWKQIGNVKKLYIFPLKSARYMTINEAECTEVGFRLMKSEANPMQLRDRSFIVYGEKDKEIKSGRAIPSLVKIQISICDESHIALDAPNMEQIRVAIPVREISNLTHVKDWSGDNIETLDCGDEVAGWLSHHIMQQNTGYRLGYNDASKRREFVKRIKGMDFYEYLSDASTSNIVVDGPDVEPFDEDNWEWMKFGDVIMRNVKECTRCAFTNVDPETGLRSTQKEPVKTLSSYRMSRGPENAPVMGIHMEVNKTGIIRSGDPVYLGN